MNRDLMPKAKLENRETANDKSLDFKIILYADDSSLF